MKQGNLTMSENSLINLGELSKPVTVLIEKISKAVGTLYEPRRIRNVAKAEAKAEKMKAETEIEITDLQMRAEQRRREEEARNQNNMEDITAKAAPYINENANPEGMDDDWIANLFNKCRIVSDNEMQSLWARVLATEANAPGSLSKRTVNILSDLDKNDADLFTKLCGFGWDIGGVVPLIFDVQGEIYKKHGINFDTLSHLENIGLIQLAATTGFAIGGLSKKDTVHYYGQRLHLEMYRDNDNQLMVGKVLLTKIGKELAPICGSKPIVGFYEYVKEQWRQYLPKSEKNKTQDSKP